MEKSNLDIIIESLLLKCKLIENTTECPNIDLVVVFGVVIYQLWSSISQSPSTILSSVLSS